MIETSPSPEPIIWHIHPTENPKYLPYERKSQPLGTEDTAAPIRKTPIVKAARVSEAPRYMADKGPIVVSSVEVVSVRDHAIARRKMFQYGESRKSPKKVLVLEP